MTTRVLKRELLNQRESLIMLIDVEDKYYSVIGSDFYNGNTFLYLSGRENPARRVHELAKGLTKDGNVLVRKNGVLYGLIGFTLEMRTYLILNTEKIG